MEEPWYATSYRLWMDFFFWLRYYITSLMLDQSGLSTAASRAFRNASDFSEFLSQFYGEAASARGEELLNQHILILSEIATTIRSGQDYSALRETFYQNADDIARFFAEMNPYWDEETWRGLLHARYDVEEILIMRLYNRDIEGATTLYDYGYSVVQEIASYMAEGLSRQFQQPLPTEQSPTS